MNEDGFFCSWVQTSVSMSEIERLIAAFWQESFRMHMERPSAQEEARGIKGIEAFKKY